MSGVSPGLLVVALALPTFGFLIRFLRWDLYLRALGNVVPRGVHLRIYVAGFALTTTPGKVGENLRAVYLEPFGVSYSQSLAAFVAERMADLVAVILLSALAGRLVGAHAWTVGAAVGLTLAGLLLLRNPRLARALQEKAPLTGWVGRVLQGVGRAVAAARELLSPRLLVAGALVAVLAWGSEGLAFALLAQSVGISIPTFSAIGVFAVATLLGAVSFLPGGVGPTEGVMVGLLVVSGASVPEAAAATVLARAVTLWWAVLLGMIAMLGMTQPARAGASKPEGGQT